MRRFVVAIGARRSRRRRFTLGAVCRQDREGGRGSIRHLRRNTEHRRLETTRGLHLRPPVLIPSPFQEHTLASGTDESGGRAAGRCQTPRIIRISTSSCGCEERGGAQPEERGPRHPPRRAGGVHRRVGVGHVFARVRRAYDEIDAIPPAAAVQRQRGPAAHCASGSRIIPATRSSASRVRSDQRYPALIRR
jgi:hypothetical protein